MHPLTHRLRVTVLALVLAVGGCAARAPDGNIWAQSRGAPAENADFGSYLAGQHARMQGDVQAAAGYFQKAIEADPDNLVLLQQGFSLAVSDGSYGLARKLADRLADSDAFNSLPRIFLLLANLKEEKYEQAIADVVDIPETGLNRLVKPLIRAWALAGAGQQAEALAALQPLDEVVAFRAFAEHHRAYILDYFNSPETEAAYRELMNEDRQQNLRSILAYSHFLARQGRAEEGIALLRDKAAQYFDEAALQVVAERLMRKPGDAPLIAGPVDGVAEAFYGGAAALSLDQAHGPAAFYLRLALYLEPDFADAHFLLGRILETEEAYEGALAAYGDIGDGHELASEARLREVWVLQGMGREKEALERLFAIIDGGTQTVEAVSALADMFREKNNFAEAAQYYTRALELVPAIEERHWVLYYARAIAYDQAKEWDRAEADLKAALELKPEQPDVLNYLGYSWVDRGLHLDVAEDMIRRAVAQRPNDGYIVDSLGWAQYKQGHYQDAVTSLERAVLLRPEDPTLNEHLGDAYWQVGRRTEARFQWSHALSLGAAEDRVAVIREKIADGLKVEGNKAARDERP